MKRERKPKDYQYRDTMISLRVSKRELEWIDDKLKDLNAWEDKPMSRTDWILKLIRDS